MKTNEIIQKINDFLIDEFEVDGNEIKNDANLQEVLDLDSLDYVDLVVIVQNKFGFKLVKEDFEGIITFQNFYDLIERKLQEVAV